MNLYYDSVCTMPGFCSRIRLHTENTEVQGALTPLFLWAHSWRMFVTRQMVVPVLPIPAEQCTSAFSLGFDMTLHSNV